MFVSFIFVTQFSLFLGLRNITKNWSSSISLMVRKTEDQTSARLDGLDATVMPAGARKVYCIPWAAQLGEK
jgi:hypothetical protein